MSVYRTGHGEIVALRFGEVLDASIALNERRIDWYSGPRGDEAATAHLLSNQVLPRVAAHEGACLVHAALAYRDSAAILVMGESGYGKSTLAVSLRTSGWTLAGDDCVIVDALDSAPVAAAVAPSLRLLPDSRERYFPEATALLPIAPYSTKCAVPDAVAPNAAPVALEAIFVLDDPEQGTDVRSRRLRETEAAIAFLDNSMALDPSDRDHAQVRFLQACSLARRLPVYSLSYPRKYSVLPKVHAAIEAQLGASVLLGHG